MTTRKCAERLKKKFVEMTEVAELVSVDRDTLVTFAIDPPTGDLQNEIFFARWTGHRGEDLRCSISEEAFEPENEPAFRDGEWFLLDTEGEATRLVFYRMGVIR